MNLALLKDDRYMEHNAGEGHPESPLRLKVIHALIETEFAEIPLIDPRTATEEELALVHTPSYIRTVAATAGRPFSSLDPDTGLSAKSYDIARLAAGGLLEAVDSIIADSRQVVAFVRPPGHHAEPGRGMGFCLFNNVAVAAAYARKKHGLTRVLIVDWDLHHGNGTQRAFYSDPGVLFFSSHQYPHYPGTGSVNEAGSGKGEGFTVNAPFPAGFGDDEYTHVYTRILKPIALEYRPELVIVSAGFDPYYKDPLGGMGVTGEGFGALAGIVMEIAQETCRGRVLISLEGGYNPEGLREGARAVLQTLLGKSRRREAAPSPQAEEAAGTIASVHKKYWKGLE